MSHTTSALVTSSTLSAAHTEPDVQEFLDRLAWALTSGSGRAAAGLWAVPAVMISDDAVHTIIDRAELERMFADARRHYAERGIIDTHGEIQSVQWVTERIALVDVRWPWFNSKGSEDGEEWSTYTLRRDDHGMLKAHVAITHEPPHPERKDD
jgi:hypothetical protein